MNTDPANYQCYQNAMSLYAEASTIKANCAEIAFLNIGTSVMTINMIPFPPQSGFSTDGKAGEMDVTNYRLNFQPGGTNLCFVITKNYTSR